MPFNITGGNLTLHLLAACIVRDSRVCITPDQCSGTGSLGLAMGATAGLIKDTQKRRRLCRRGTARSGGRPGQTRKIPRHLLAASAFTLDRLLAILHAILPDELRTSIDIYRQIATLSSLRLLVRAGGIGTSDPLEPGGKWRVGPMITWEHIQSVARGLDFNLIDYVAE